MEPGAVSFTGVGADLVIEQADGSLVPQIEAVQELLTATFVTCGP